MSRATRLFDLLQALRRRRAPVSGAALARETGVSLRTLYRDIAALQALGAEIEGEAGVGYVLKPGFMLPPLMLSEEEIEALALGAKWVARRTDNALAASARNAMAKIGAVLPVDLRQRLAESALLVGPSWLPPRGIDLAVLRQAVRQERKLRIAYRDEGGRPSQRTIWPIALSFFESARVITAWCELREDFRHFRADRIEAAELSTGRYPRRRHSLVKDWEASLLTETDSSDGYCPSIATQRRPGGSEASMDQEIVFYTNPMSRGGIVHWMLEELGVPYRLEPLEYGPSMKAPAYLAINPMGKVPAIRHGAVVITEAAAICAYLADAFPAAGLAPPPAERGAYYRWLFFGAGPVEAALGNQSCGFHPTPKQAMMIGYGTLDATAETLAGAVAGKRFIVGDSFSAADVYIGSQIGWGMRFGTLPKRPEFEAYWDGLKDRPAHRRVESHVEAMMAELAPASQASG